MVKTLRNKFVLVTTTLMVTVFSLFLIINTIYNNYWNDIEIVEMLEWIGDSGIFSIPMDQYSEHWVEGITEEDTPIVGITLDREFHVLRQQVLGKGKELSIPEEALQRMCQNSGSTNKMDSYYFSHIKLPDEKNLLVVMDTSLKKKDPLKILGVIGLGVAGVSFLILVTLFLSVFVTRPAEESLLREKRFISDASHELKTPLGAISINAQAIKLANEDNLYINNILSESERMNRLIDRLLTLARLDEEADVITEPVSLSEICEEMALTYESVMYEKRISMDYEVEPNLWMIGNADEIRQLVAILLDNAVKNTLESGQIILKVDAVKKEKIICVSNTGKGIREENLPHVFERFYTSDTARESNSFGLGLAIAKAIAERHKGTIEVESIPDKITTFRIIF